MSTSLSHTTEQRIVKRKWYAAILLIIGGVLLAGRLPVPGFLPFSLFLLGHLGMAHQMFLKRDHPLLLVNVIWVMIDILGIVRAS